MLIIPAIDLKDGRCVRLQQGELQRETVFSHNPPEMAQNWEQLGGEFLHIVDLDGAFSGIPRNKGVIEEIRRAIQIPIQLGGGIRDLETIEQYLVLGVNRVIIGTAAYQEEGFISEACARFPGQIVVGIDARNGSVAIKGWAEQTDLSALTLARRCEQAGVAAIVYTDIQRDGMLTGINLAATQALAREISIPVIASGGVAKMEDIVGLMPLAQDGVVGVIVGRALYEGTIDLREAIRVAKKKRVE
jgi:phosphoribosylformimino-5-aminoimidazole carboxamide ribotide isomerase